MSFDLKLENGDLLVKSGDLQTVENNDKLVQDILKILSTPMGGNPFFPAYGSPINSAMIGNYYDIDFVRNVTTQQIRTTLERLQQLQADQLRNNQIVTPFEQLAAIQSVSVNNIPQDPRYYAISLTVISKAFRRVDIPFMVVSA
jgi:hypothetical protein